MLEWLVSRCPGIVCSVIPSTPPPGWSQMANVSMEIGCEKVVSHANIHTWSKCHANFIIMHYIRPWVHSRHEGHFQSLNRNVTFGGL